MAATKISVAIMLLRLEQRIKWRRFLWFMILLQLALGLYNMLTQLLQCIPIQAAWDLDNDVTNSKCWSRMAFRASAVTVQLLNALTDWVFALLPISFLRKVQRPVRERIIIGILMALGVFAGGASLVKIDPIVRLGYSGDYTVEHMRIGAWSCIEELVAFSCSCVPGLRAPFQRALEYLGMASTDPNSQYNRAYGPMNVVGTGAMKSRSKSKKMASQSHGGLASMIRMTGLGKGDGQSEEHMLTSTGEGAKANGIWMTTEVTMEEEKVRSNVAGRSGDVVDAKWASASGSVPA
jgi:hypothetical protein